jgi:hypothetical protein
MRGMATFVPGDLELLGRGLAQAPDSTMIEAGMAAAEVRAGRVAAGRARLERLCARHPTATTAGMTFARRLLENETLQAEMGEINRLSSANQWDDVIAIADLALARRLEPAARKFMEDVRQRTRAYQKFRTAIDFANRGEFADASQTIQAVIASKPEPAVEKEAQRILREITKRRDRKRSGRE